MPLNECVEVYQKTLDDLKKMEMALQNMKQNPAPLAVRWNQLMLAMMLSRLNTLKNRNPGMTDNDTYMQLQRLTISCRKHMLEGSEPLKELDRQTWEFLLRAAMGRPLPAEIPLPEVRKISLALCNAVCEDAFQQRLRSQCAGKNVQEKNQVLVTILMDAQFDLFKDFGYTGEDGYICVQKNLVEYAGDSVVLAFTSAYNTILLEVAEIDPNAAGVLPKFS